MKDKPQISPSQLTWLTVVSMVSLGIFTFPREVAEASGDGAALSFAVALGVALVGATLLARLAETFPASTGSSYAQRILGRPLGLIFGLVVALFYTAFVALITRNTSDLLKTTLYEATPVEVLMIVFLLTTAYAAQKGIVGVSRVVGLALPVVYFALLVLYLLALTQGRLIFLIPHWPGSTALFQGAFRTMYVFLGFPVLLMVLPFLEKPRTATSRVKIGVFLNALLLIEILVAAFAVFGPSGVRGILYPSVQVLTQTQIHGWLIERLGLFVAIGWAVIDFCGVAVFLWAISTSTAQLLGLKPEKFWYVMAVLIPLVIILAKFPANTEQVAILMPIFSAFGLAVAVVLPIFLWAVARVRGFEGRSEHGGRPDES